MNQYKLRNSRTILRPWCYSTHSISNLSIPSSKSILEENRIYSAVSSSSSLAQLSSIPLLPQKPLLSVLIQKKKLIMLSSEDSKKLQVNSQLGSYSSITGPSHRSPYGFMRPWLKKPSCARCRTLSQDEGSGFLRHCMHSSASYVFENS